MIHGGGGALVDHGEPAIAVIRMKPAGAGGQEHIGSVILCAADADIGIGWVNGDADELSRAQGGIILVYPGVAAVGGLPDATIIAAVADEGVRGGHFDLVSISVSGGGMAGEGSGAAVE